MIDGGEGRGGVRGRAAKVGGGRTGGGKYFMLLWIDRSSKCMCFQFRCRCCHNRAYCFLIEKDCLGFIE